MVRGDTGGHEGEEGQGGKGAAPGRGAAPVPREGPGAGRYLRRCPAPPSGS